MTQWGKRTDLLYFHQYSPTCPVDNPEVEGVKADLPVYLLRVNVRFTSCKLRSLFLLSCPLFS